MRSKAVFIALLAVAIALMVMPAAASAATENAWGNFYAGDGNAGSAGACFCHFEEEEPAPSPHSEMVKNIDDDPTALTPAAGDDWPAPTTIGGIEVASDDVFLQLGNGFGALEYVGFLDSPAVVPAGDWPLYDPLAWNQGTGAWELDEDPVEAVAYFQRCGGCHNLGVTRPSEATATLANGAEIGPNTPTEFAALSIQCENCHGTGTEPVPGDRHAPGADGGVPNVVGPEDSFQKIYNSQICGQCHVNGVNATDETRFGSETSKFSNANGFTVDETLTAYFAPRSEVPTEGEFLANPDPWYFFPNGSNRRMRHSYYNEWLQNKADNGFGHFNPTNARVQASEDPSLCLKCHSGEGFLARIGVEVPESVIGTDVASIGISCTVCHKGHIPNTNDPADYAREGVDSSMGDMEMTVNCGSCHNWQFEVLEQSKQSENGQDRPAMDSRVRHPSREILPGDGLWGLDDDDYAVFMPGTTCPSCHMPDTYSETGGPDDYIGAPNVRQSHRFHVMTPGDAEEWDVRPGGDSCTICHPSLSRSALQAWLDDTESMIEDKAADVEDALGDIATDQGGGSYTTFMGAQPGTWDIDEDLYAILQRASQNVDYVNNGIGIHNPPYAMDGLEVAMMYAGLYDADITLEAGDDAVLPGANVPLSGLVTDTEGPVMGAMVMVESSADGVSWDPVATVMTDSMGEYVTFGEVPDGGALFRASWMPVSDVDFMVMTDEVLVETVSDGGGGVIPIRIAGNDRYDTSAKLSESVFGDMSVANIVVASGADFPDALSASGLAGTVGSPILLVAKDSVPSAIADEITRIASDDVTTTVWVVGGPVAVSPDTMAALGALPGVEATQRVFGPDRFETSAEVCALVAAIQDDGFVESAFAANGLNFPDALAVSPVAYANGWPVLLVGQNAVPPSVSDVIASTGIDTTVVLGGEAVVSGGVYTALNADDRWAGSDRYGTAVDIAESAIDGGFADADYVGVASGVMFPDALSGGPVAGSYGGVMMLTAPDALPSATAGWLDDNALDIFAVDIYGGTVAVSNAVRLEILDIVNGL
jgi:putative cell wall-binding protein